MKKIKRTGIASVDTLYGINFTGNVIPHSWYRTIVTEAGKPDCKAIFILAEILYWHRPRESCGDEDAGETVLVKKFGKDMLQMSYAQLEKKLNLSKSQCRRGIERLERLGLIKRYFRDEDTASYGRLHNVMYLELFSDRLVELTFPDGEYQDAKNAQGSLQKCNDVMSSREPCGNENLMTNTKITTEITYKDYPLYQSEMERVRDQIDYDILIKDRKLDKGIIDNIVDIIVEINMSRRKTLIVNSEPVDADLVKARLKALDAEMIRTILDRIKDSVVAVGNMKTYLITILFNTPATYETELAMQVSRDMYINSNYEKGQQYDRTQ